MVLLPVCGNNPLAVANGLSYVHVSNHSITILYHLYQCRTCTLRGIMRTMQFENKLI